MKTLLRLRTIELSLIFTIFCMCLSCSHLNVGVDPAWSAKNISVVSVEHDLAPDNVTTADIGAILTRGGWQVVQDPSQAQARVVCRWSRQTELSSESEAIVVVKSFHVQIISVENPRVLAVADYFYANDNEKLIDGVVTALTAITQYHPATTAQQAQQENVPTNAVAPTTARSAAAPTTGNPAALPTAQENYAISAVAIVQPAPAMEHSDTSPAAIPNETLPVQEIKQLSNPELVNMERSPWVPRFQGFGLDEWGEDAPRDE